MDNAWSKLLDDPPHSSEDEGIPPVASGDVLNRNVQLLQIRLVEAPAIHGRDEQLDVVSTSETLNQLDRLALLAAEAEAIYEIQDFVFNSNFTSNQAMTWI